MIDQQEEVQYRELLEYPGYRLGSDGTVWRRWVTCRKGRVLSDKWRPMKLGLTSKGYHKVNLTKQKHHYKTFRVHRLILLSFIGPCPNDSEGRHLNGIKTDNRLSNLAWGTQQENCEDNHRLGAYPVGSFHPTSKLSEKDIVEIRRLRTAKTPLKAIAAQFKTSISNVSAIINRRSWSHVL